MPDGALRAAERICASFKPKIVSEPSGAISKTWVLDEDEVAQIIIEETACGEMLKLHDNDQCDLVYGRLRRLVEKEPELIDHIEHLSAIDLGIDGLGVSGAQVEMVLEQLKADRYHGKAEAKGG